MLVLARKQNQQIVIGDDIYVKVIRMEGDVVKLISVKGEVFTGSYLVDATGMKSVLAHKFDLRDDSSTYLTNSRAIFT